MVYRALLKYLILLTQTIICRVCNKPGTFNMIGMSITEGSRSWKEQKSTNGDLTKVLFTSLSFARCLGSHFCCFLHTPHPLSKNDCLRSKHCFCVQTKRGKHSLSPARVITSSEVFLEFPGRISFSRAG